MGTKNFFFVPHSRQDKTPSFFTSLPSSKLTISLISIYKHYAIDIADPSTYAGCMSYELHNRPHSLWSLCGSVVEHKSMESEGLGFNSSWGLRIFSLSHACNKMENNIFLYVTSPHNIPHIIWQIGNENIQTYQVEVVILKTH